MQRGIHSLALVYRSCWNTQLFTANTVSELTLTEHSVEIGLCYLPYPQQPIFFFVLSFLSSSDLIGLKIQQCLNVSLGV